MRVLSFSTLVVVTDCITNTTPMSLLKRCLLPTLGSAVRRNVGTRTINAVSSTRPVSAQAQCMTDIGCREIFTEDHDLFRKTARQFFKEQVIPFHDEWEDRGECSRDVWLSAGATGLLGVNTPASDGGHGADYLYAALLHEEQMYANTTGPGFPLHSDVAMPYISHYGTKEQKEKYLPDMTAGRKIGAIAMTEPGAGSDLQGIRTHAIRSGSDWILNGSKVFITNGFMCDVVIVAAFTNKDAKSPAHGLSLFLVDKEEPGFKKGRKLKKIGHKAQDTSELFFEDVRLPESAVLGELNSGFYMMMKDLPQERLVVATLATAGCEFMFEETRSYVRGRKAFKKTLADLQTIQHKLAEIKTEICVTRAFVDNCLQTHSTTGLDSNQASMAKYWCSDLQNRVADRCLQMHGGWGYMWEYPIAKAFVDARLQPIYGGANEIMKELIKRPIIT